MNKLNIVIDFDSTLVKVEALEELANIALNKDREKLQKMKIIGDITNQGMNGMLSFDKSLQKRLDLFKANRNMIEKLTNLLFKSISESINANREFLRQNRENIYIVSGGFREYIIPIILGLGLKEENVLANSFIFNQNGDVVGVNKNLALAHENGKVKAVSELGLKGRTIVVGDGMTDYQIKQFGYADMFICYCENVEREKVAKFADRIIYSFNDVEALISDLSRAL